jgi:hypothetical protein
MNVGTLATESVDATRATPGSMAAGAAADGAWGDELVSSAHATSAPANRPNRTILFDIAAPSCPKWRGE